MKNSHCKRSGRWR